QRRIAGYVTAKKGKTGNKATSKREQRKFTCFAEREWVRAIKGIKRQALLEDNVNNIFERKLNSFIKHAVIPTEHSDEESPVCFHKEI
ncbi:MAG: hypothetical protein IKY47_03970, partial [Bacteroidaceae bacterium]|nr:hypothetical protein [Bacteroidaceae bacterium]